MTFAVYFCVCVCVRFFSLSVHLGFIVWRAAKWVASSLTRGLVCDGRHQTRQMGEKCFVVWRRVYCECVCVWSSERNQDKINVHVANAEFNSSSYCCWRRVYIVQCILRRHIQFNVFD